MTIFGYTRVSTTEQADPSRSSLDDQARAIKGAAMMKGWPEPLIFSDPGVSGATPLSDRPAGAEVLSAMQSGDILLVAKMDRIFRSAMDALATVEQLRGENKRLVLCDMGPDPVTENGAAKMFFTIMAAMAEFERTRIAERMADGRKSKKERGGHIGGLAPYGYAIVGTGRDARLEQDEAEQATIREARELRMSGSSLRAVSLQLANRGFVSRTGQPFAPEQVARLCDTGLVK